MKKDIRQIGFKSIVGFRGDSLTCPQAFGGDVYAGCSMGCWWCLTEDTNIQMAGGKTKFIKDIHIGEEVVTFNEKTKILENKKVINTMHRKSKIIVLKIGQINLKITTNHEIFTQRGWVPAGKLINGDRILKVK